MILSSNMDISFNNWVMTHRPIYSDVFLILNLGYISYYISSNKTRQMIYNMSHDILTNDQLYIIYNEIGKNIIKYGKIASPYIKYFDELLFILLYLGLFFDNMFYDDEYKNAFYNNFYTTFISAKPNAFNEILTNIRFHLM